MSGNEPPFESLADPVSGATRWTPKVPDFRWFIARCQDCTPLLDIPFRDQSERDEWATEHVAGTGHHVELLTARPSDG